MGLADWGSFLSKLMDKLPIQGRIERCKNELDRLKLERSDILVNKKADDKNRKRLADITFRIAELECVLKNKASD